MSDLRDQLAAIRPKVSKSTTAIASDKKPSDNSQDKKIGPKQAKSAPDPLSNLREKCLGRLSWFGRIDKYDISRGFGYISSDTQSFFFHVSGILSSEKGKISADLRGCNIVYAKGSTEKGDRAVQWAFIDEVPWPEGTRPGGQHYLDTLRRKWLAQKDLEYLFAYVQADWYKGSLVNSMPSVDLSDPVLETVLKESLQKLSPDEWRSLKVCDVIQKGRYSFLNDWNWKSHRVPTSLLRDFSAEQLEALGEPQPEWVASAAADLMPKLIEWACRAKLKVSQTQKWRNEISRQFAGDADLACGLLDSQWQPTLLGMEWIKLLISSERLASSEIFKRLQRCPKESEIWLSSLSLEEQVNFLASENATPEALGKALSSRNNPDLDRMALFRYAISVDIESDGERIWEIGIADSRRMSLPLARSDSPQKLQGAINDICDPIIQSRLVIGHNIVAWDWPILSRHLSQSRTPILWDTMLVGFMLAPWRASHSLGGSHRADEDARDAFQLFQSQLEQIGGGIARKLLLGEIQDTSSLMSLLDEQLSSVAWTIPAMPEELEACRSEWVPGKTLIVHPIWIYKINWLPDVCVVSVDNAESLDVQMLVIDESLAQEVERRGLSDDPFSLALLHVKRKTDQYGIFLRPSMLPTWLRGKPGIEEAVCASATSAPDLGSSLAIAPYPRRAGWYQSIQSGGFIFVDPPESGFVAEFGWRRASDLPLPFQSQILLGGDITRSGTLYRIDVSTDPRAVLWAALDPAAVRLSMSGKCFRTMKTIDSPRNDSIQIVRTSAKLKCRPLIFDRAETTLYPGAQDQASYWRGVIGGLQTVVGKLSSGTVPLLLIVSTASVELLGLVEQSLCEISMGVPFADYHSRKDRLLKASLTPGACLVGTLDSWSAWQMLGFETGVSICPVIECLPIGDWFATNATDNVEDDVPEEITPETDSTENERDGLDEIAEDAISEDEDIRLGPAHVISGADIAARTHELVLANIERWLRQMGLDSASNPCIVLDPRIPWRNRNIRQIFECLDWKEREISDGQHELLNQILEPLSIKREPAPNDYESMRDFLVKHWNNGISKDSPSWIADFRVGTQQPAIEAIRDRSADVLVSLPTGEGKSVLFQVPALCKGLHTRRLSIVISPLRALMRDQVHRLWEIGFHQSVDYLTADRPIHEIDDVYQGVLDHRIVLLYVAPERFRSRRFMDVIDRRFASDGAFEYVVIDEAHCVSQWGYEFRPDYFYALNSVCNKYRNPNLAEKSPMLLLSATVTAANREHLSSLVSGSASPSNNGYLEFKSRPDQYFHPIRNHIEIQPKAVPGRINTRPRSDWPIAPRLEIILALISESTQNKKATGQHSSLIIFVSRRDHAEEVCFMLANRLSAAGEKTTVDFFHAGLDSESRNDVYQRFLLGEIDVLVATKAFGMGMDISHIHWAVHLAPPTFLEDYLQEVGRIGRGEKERKSAKLDQLTAALLFSPEDFESNRTFIQMSRIEMRQIADLYEAICEHARSSEGGGLVAMMPDSGFSLYSRQSAAVQTRKMLYWLERLGRIEILAMMPGLLPVRLNFSALAKIAETEAGPLAEVAKLLQLIQPSREASSENRGSASLSAEKQDRSYLERLIDGLSSFVGVLLGVSNRPDAQASSGKENRFDNTLPLEREGDAIINLGQIWRDSSLGHIDDVLATITQLEERQALEVARTIRFSRRSYSHADPAEINQLFSSLEEIALRVVKQLENQSEYIIDFEALSNGMQTTVASAELNDVRLAMEKSVCYLLRSAGVRVRDRVVNGNRALQATLSKKQASKIARRVKATIAATRALWQDFLPRLNREERVIGISRLLATSRHHSENNRFRERDLRRYLGLLGVMRLIGVSESLVPMSYVLAVHRTDEILDELDHPEIWTELGKVNRLTELRGDALEVFVHLSPDARDSFIQGYFEQTGPEEMEAFLNEQLGQVDTDRAGTFIDEKREQLQAKAVVQFLERYNVEPEEPNQWLAISHSFDRNLLVNAGPGSGKTSVLLARIAHLIRFQHIRPEEILVLAFNRAVVFEIRARIRELFGKLGYGAYVRRLDVATFHGFAMRHLGRLMKDTDDWNKDRSTLLSRFADKLETDSAFRLAVSGNLRCVLVDEFQDVNDEIYRVIRGVSAQPNRAAAVMVIGDDDQDILRWNRENGTSSEPYFRSFIRDYSLTDSDIVTLAVNFRSGPQIVERTQKFLNNFFGRHGAKSSRIKTNELRSVDEAEDAAVNAVDLRGDSLDTALDMVREAIDASKTGTHQSVAVLCRTNHEVALAYHHLMRTCPELVVYNNVSYPVSRLRHIGTWLDLLKNDLAAYGDQPLADPIFNRVDAVYQSSDIPEVRAPSNDALVPRQLWDLCKREASYPYLSHLIDFVESLDSDDVIRLIGHQSSVHQPPVVSTIHKIKGLEFDKVFVLPSYASFPFQTTDRAAIFENAAEEARLMYVALTRAKRSVTYYIGDREQAWWNAKSFEGNLGSGKMLVGSPAKEVGISWAWKKISGYNPNPESTLSYIQSTVRVGDKLSVGGYGSSLFHSTGSSSPRQVGYLAEASGGGGSASDLEVSAVLRLPYDEEGKQYYGPVTATAPSVRKQGWGLVVLAAGILRR